MDLPSRTSADVAGPVVNVSEAYKTLLNLGKELKEKENKNEIEEKDEAYHLITLLKFNVALYSRLSIISFYSFIESFVNAISFDFLYRNENNLTKKEIDLLKGFKKGRYLQIENKLEKLPTLIRTDTKQIIFIKDEKQRKEPFKSFIENYKNLRDASVHYSPFKEKIWLKPNDWFSKAKEFSNLTIDIASEFWKACYPKRDRPEYLGKLNYELHLNIAKDRLKKETDLRRTYLKK